MHMCRGNSKMPVGSNNRLQGVMMVCRIHRMCTKNCPQEKYVMTYQLCSLQLNINDCPTPSSKHSSVMLRGFIVYISLIVYSIHHVNPNCSRCVGHVCNNIIIMSTRLQHHRIGSLHPKHPRFHHQMIRRSDIRC